MFAAFARTLAVVLVVELVGLAMLLSAMKRPRARLLAVAAPANVVTHTLTWLILAYAPAAHWRLLVGTTIGAVVAEAAVYRRLGRLEPTAAAVGAALGLNLMSTLANLLLLGGH